MSSLIALKNSFLQILWNGFGNLDVCLEYCLSLGLFWGWNVVCLNVWSVLQCFESFFFKFVWHVLFHAWDCRWGVGERGWMLRIMCKCGANAFRDV